jgi:hypothetical protein
MKIIMKHQLLLVIITILISCKKTYVPETAPEPAKSYIQFVDYTTGDPIRNLNVKRWNYKDLPSGSNYIVYKDSLITDSEGNCIFENVQQNDLIRWSSFEYFDDNLEILYGNGMAQNNSLQLIKSEGNTRYYQARLFPKLEVTVHIKQLTPIKPDSTSYGTYLKLSVLAYNNGSARNEINFVSEQNFLPECDSCTIYLMIKENQLLDIKMKGYLVKNLFNDLKFSVRSIDDFEPSIIKQGIISIENRIIGSQGEIMLTF